MVPKRRDSEDAPAGDFLAGKAIPPFAALRAFEVVGRVGGVRRAAALLRLDHTVVSRHLKALEEWLGVMLVDRQGGRLTLTEAGQAYHARVSAAMLDVVSATREIMAQGQIHDLRLWCVPGFATQWLSAQIAAFEQTAPGFQVELRPTDRPANLIRFEADVDIRYYGDAWLPQPGGPGLHTLVLARPPLLVVASPAVAAGMAGIGGVADLLGAPLLHEEHHEQWRHWLRGNGCDPGMGLCLARSCGTRTWPWRRRAGRGLALANRYLVADDLASGALVELSVPGAQPVAIGSYCMVTRADRANNPAIAQLRHFLRQQVA
jgi:DNA-binding transcriptional LysR family regulator